jgi:hypothetical protein
MSEFNWWLLIVGLVVGAGLVWLVLADSARREADVDARELPAEAAWIADSMADQGRPIDRSDAEEVLRLHRAYLSGPPPDDEPGALDEDATEPLLPEPGAPDPDASGQREAADRGEPAA